MSYDAIDTRIPVLGHANIESPLSSQEKAVKARSFVAENKRVVIEVDSERLLDLCKKNRALPSFELAGPREKIYFNPDQLTCAIVTCGGLCPGLNDIIRSIVLELHYSYGVQNILGIPFGLQGLIPDYGHEIQRLTPESVLNILDMGGSILGSSRGAQNVEKIVDNLEKLDVGILFMSGGDGTLKASNLIADEILRRDLKISVIGIPKTIDNDIYLVSRSFGFDTAVEVASQAIRGAHNEAAGYPNGIALIKLMGRHSGYIAATAALARQDVNFVLVPEVDFDLHGENGFLAALERRISSRKHVVIVVAEGAGQKFFESMDDEQDESGNVRLKDIGIFLKEQIVSYFKDKGIDISLKYIDPSYTIRNIPANASDRVFCGFLGCDAVHAGMAGKTKMLVGHWNNHFLHIPMEASVGRRKHIDPNDKLWRTVLEITGQGSIKN